MISFGDVVYWLVGGTCFQGDAHFQAVIHEPAGWVAIDIMDILHLIFSGYRQSLPGHLVFGWFL
jgi:hypothetical protein